MIALNRLQKTRVYRVINSSSLRTTTAIALTSLLNFAMPVMLARSWSLNQFAEFMGIWNVVSLIGFWFIGLQVTVTFLTQESILQSKNSYFDFFTRTSFLFLFGLTWMVLPSAIFFRLANGNFFFQVFIVSSTIISSGLCAISFGRIIGRGRLKLFYDINLVLGLLKALIVVVSITMDLSIFQTLTLLLIKQIFTGFSLVILTSSYCSLETSIFRARPLSIFFATATVWTFVYLDVTFLNLLIGSENTGKYASVSSIAKGWIILVGFLATYLSSSSPREDRFIFKVIWGRYLYFVIFCINLIFAFVALVLGDVIITLIQGDKFQESGLLFAKLLLSYNCYAILLVYTIKNRQIIQKCFFQLVTPLLMVPILAIVFDVNNIDVFLFIFCMGPLTSLTLMSVKVRLLSKLVKSE